MTDIIFCRFSLMRLLTVIADGTAVAMRYALLLIPNRSAACDTSYCRRCRLLWRVMARSCKYQIRPLMSAVDIGWLYCH
jgi:hypothetical protein